MYSCVCLLQISWWIHTIMKTCSSVTFWPSLSLATTPPAPVSHLLSGALRLEESWNYRNWLFDLVCALIRILYLIASNLLWAMRRIRSILWKLLMGVVIVLWFYIFLALIWAFYFLAKHPEMQDRCYEEINSVWTTDSLSWEVIKQLKWVLI